MIQSTSLFRVEREGMAEEPACWLWMKLLCTGVPRTHRTSAQFSVLAASEQEVEQGRRGLAGPGRSQEAYPTKPKAGTGHDCNRRYSPGTRSGLGRESGDCQAIRAVIPHHL